MDFALSPAALDLRYRLTDFMERYVIPHHAQWAEETMAGKRPVLFMEDLKALAKEEGLWNLFLPALPDDAPGQGLSNLDYAPLAEVMGRLPWASEAFNCSAPDTCNMELLNMFATPAQRDQWLRPLFDGAIRSCFAMTEPDVASSDATNVTTSIRREGGDYIINGRKWFITGAADPRTKLALVMGKTDPCADTHRQQSIVLVPMDTPGLTVTRDIPVMGRHGHESHGEIVFRNCRVPAENLLGDEGEGFAMAQARLGPGRIHHCMRSIGQAELALEMMAERALERKTFGRYLHDQGQVQEMIALSRMEIDQARLLVLRAAWTIDTHGVKAARTDVSAIKVVVARMLQAVSDRAMQLFGAMGLSSDTPLPELWIAGRTLRVFDGPDEVHLRTVARTEMSTARDRAGASMAYFTLPDRASEISIRDDWGGAEGVQVEELLTGR